MRCPAMLQNVLDGRMAGATNRTRTCDPVITKGEFAGFAQFTPERSNAFKFASWRDFLRSDQFRTEYPSALTRTPFNFVEI
jgi:hypothetical protein